MRTIRKKRSQEDPKRIDPETILREAKNVDFRQKSLADEFKFKYNQHLLGRMDISNYDGNILHSLAASKDPDWTDDKMGTFLDWLLKDYSGLLEKTDRRGYSPLHYVLLNNRHAFVSAVLSYPDLKSLGPILNLTCNDGNNLHIAIERENMKMLERAISVAETKEILMFCSASDQGGYSVKGCYPGDQEKCIKIGGATSTGEKLPWVHEKSYNFLLPRKKIPFTNADGSMFTESGSSVATAAPSGLAGLLIICSRVLDQGSDRFFRNRRNMMAAFTTLSMNNEKFPKVNHIFNQMFKKLLLADVPEHGRSKRFIY
ncbi:hypothetical protein DV736_g2071, partial [Chaetothyriales sp. CBS 134916]